MADSLDALCILPEGTTTTAYTAGKEDCVEERQR
jgi:hypothetical protein